MEHLDELEFLAETAGAVGVKKFIQKVDRPDSRTYIRNGKLQEIREYCEENEIEVVIFDDELSPTQLRNIERELNIRILDRTNLSDECIPGKPVVELLGDCRLLIENHRGIVEYHCDRISVRVCYGMVMVKGRNLKLRQMSGGKLLIVGEIDCIGVKRM
jgi:sporulation protein YqfC